MSASPQRVTITPELARQWLKLNIDNPRGSYNDLRAREMAHAMRQGRWVEDAPCGIVFDEQGRLCDGQHRLHAIIYADRPVTMWVFRDVPNAARAVIDRGQSRDLRGICSDLPSRFVDAAAHIMRRLLHYRYPQEYQIRELSRTPLYAAFLSLGAATKNRRAPASVLVPALIHALNDLEYVSMQWDAWCRFDNRNMSPAVNALHLWQLRNAQVISSRNATDLSSRAWVAFDPLRRFLTRIILRGDEMQQMREHLRSNALKGVILVEVPDEPRSSD
jgi:hypothetical protein